MIKYLLPKQYRDNYLMKMEVSEALNQIKTVIFAPDAASKNSGGAFFEFTFDAVVRLEFETAGMGEPVQPIEIWGIYLKKGEELKRWRRRFASLARANDNGCTTLSEKGYNDVYHVVLESPVYMGFPPREHLHGIQIVCRHIEKKDVTSQWHHVRRPKPYRIPAHVRSTKKGSGRTIDRKGVG